MMKRTAIAIMLLGCVWLNAAETGFRIVWVGSMTLNLDRSMKRIQQSGFNAIAISGGNTVLISEYANRHGIAVYYWCHLLASESTGQYVQQLSPEDEKLPGSDSNGAQRGGEPTEGRSEKLELQLLCIHRQESAEWLRRQIKAAAEKFPELSGIALDSIGYRNYRGCHCETSLKMYEQYCKDNGLERSDAQFTKFSLETLIKFYNQTADYIRELKPEWKIVVAIYPTFLPEPRYGNRLNVDYYCQNVAAAAPPFWSKAKIAKCVEELISNEKQFIPQARAIPLLTFFPGLKPISQFASELQAVKEYNHGRRDLSVSPYLNFATSPEPGIILIKEFNLQE